MSVRTSSTSKIPSFTTPEKPLPFVLKVVLTIFASPKPVTSKFPASLFATVIVANLLNSLDRLYFFVVPQ